MIESWKKSLLDLYSKHEKQLEIAFFVGGFIFDILFLSAIDDLFSIFQQAFYLFVIAFILHHEILFRMQKWRPRQSFLIQAWAYRELILHFLLGSLLSVYSLFYIKSASLVSSILFLLGMIALLIANELPVVKSAKVSFKVGLFAICLFSFISIIYPLIFGFVGKLPFLLSVVTTMGLFYLQIRFLKSRLPDVLTHFQAILLPGVSVVVVFTLFYFLGWIPPVPLSAKDQGVYHSVQKKDGKYLLSFEKVWWKFWDHDDQNFKAQPGDKIYYYVQIYSPTRFSDQVFVRWSFKDPRQGWVKTDRIPLAITGGREEGFRASTMKSNFQPGEWRVQVETDLGHEITRYGFEVEVTAPDSEREFKVREK